MDSLLLPEVPKKDGYHGNWNINVDDLKPENTVISAVYTEMTAQEKWDAFFIGCNGTLPSVMGCMGIMFISTLALFERKARIYKSTLN